MARYAWDCPACQHTEDDFVPSAQRDDPRPCGVCGTEMKRQFPLEAIFGYMPFEPFFDEGLGVDITGREQHRHVMKALNVHEAGDPVHGGRNYDRHAPHQVKRLPPREIRLVEKPDPRQILQEQTVTIHEKDGREHTVNLSELKPI